MFSSTLVTRLRQSGWVCIAIGPFLFWVAANPGFISYLVNSAPSGQVEYLLSRLCALYAFVLVSVQLVLVLSQTSTFSVRQHALLGGLAVFFLLMHSVLFVAAASVRSGGVAWHLFIPNFFSGYYTFAVSLGALGFWFFIAVFFTGTLRVSGRNSRFYKVFHRLALVAYILIFIHGISIGSDVQILGVNILYFVAGFVVLLFVCKWLLSVSSPSDIRN